MTDNIITIPVDVLLHCAKVVAKNDKHHENLHAIHIDDGRVIATNGVAMIIYTVPELKGHTFTMSLPLHKLKGVVQTLKGYKMPGIAYNTETRILNAFSVKIQLEPYEWGEYPDYRKVTPDIDKIGGATGTIGIDPAQLALFGESVVHFTGNAGGTMVVETYEYPGEYLWYGLLMPMNTNEKNFTSHLLQQLTK